MPKFVFQLEGVLRQRKYVEQERQRELAIVLQQMSEHERELRLLNEQVQVSTADIRANRLVGRLDMAFLAAHRRFMLAMQRKALTLVQKMALLQRQVDERREALAHAAKRRKAIERLRETHRERWMKTLSRRELSEQDEIGMQLSYWNMSEETAAAEERVAPEPGGAEINIDRPETASA